MAVGHVFFLYINQSFFISGWGGSCILKISATQYDTDSFQARPELVSTWAKVLEGEEPALLRTCKESLAWRIPGTGEPGGLPSMGSHRVGHDWSDLAAAAARRVYLSLRKWKENNSAVLLFPNLHLEGCPRLLKKEGYWLYSASLWAWAQFG